MNLPQISLPHIPFEITFPHLVHPCMIHLVVALPLIILLLEVINLFTKNRDIGIISFFLMLLLGLTALFAYKSGAVDAEMAKKVASADVAKLIDEHKLLAIYIIYGSVVLVAFKIVSILFRNTATRILLLLFLVIFTIMMVNQSKRGKALVYEHGVNVKMSSVVDDNVKRATLVKVESETNASSQIKGSEVNSSISDSNQSSGN